MARLLHGAWVLTALALVACGPKHEARRAPAEGEREVVGRIVRVDDADYPMFYVHVVTPGRASELPLQLNAAKAELGGRNPEAFKGQNVSIAYVTEHQPSLADIRIDDVSVLGQDDPLISVVGMSEVTGVLGGAADVTEGDQPGAVTVTDAAGKVMTFSAFVSPEMADANGALVTAFYTDRAQARVTAIRPLTN